MLTTASNSRVTVILLTATTAVLFIGAVWAGQPWFNEPEFYALLVYSLAGFALAALGSFRRWPRVILWLQGVWGVAGWQMALLFAGPGLALLARLAAGDALLAHFPRLAVGSWVVAITAVVIGAVNRPSANATEPSPPRTRLWWAELLLVALLTFIALQLRLIALNQFPTTLAGDEGSAGLAAVEFREGTVTNLFVTSWFSFPALYFAVQSLGIGFWGQTIEGLRLASAVAGGLTVPAVYGLGRQTYGWLTGLIAAVLLAGSHYHIHFSRIGLNNIWDGLFIALILLALWQGWQTGRRRWFLWCGFLLGLSQYFYVSARIFPVLVLLWCLLAGWVQRDRWRKNLPSLSLAALLSVVVYLPLALYFVSHPDVFQAPMNRVTIFDWWLDNEATRFGVSQLGVVLAQIRLSFLGITHQPLRAWYVPEMALLRWPATWLFWLGVGLTFVRQELRGLLLGLPLLTAVLLGAFSQDTPAAQRYVVVCVLAVLFTAVPFGLAVDWVKQRGTAWVRPLMAVGLAVALFVAVADVRFYFGELYEFYTLGGPNTEVATAVGRYLRQQENPEQDVYFVGHPRMQYASHATVPYLAPRMHGRDLNEPLTAPPTWLLRRDSIFVFLPERGAELAYIEEAFPHGRVRQIANRQNELLFLSYEVEIPEP
ncbi:MAG: glycosyltransferase family 39 protein [Anaerolineales bacterium]|nr:glycosyltransferase family 39 protein [Anaerolineales bacterium]